MDPTDGWDQTLRIDWDSNTILAESNYTNLIALTYIATQILYKRIYLITKHDVHRHDVRFTPEELSDIAEFGEQFSSLAQYIENYVPIYFDNRSGHNVGGTYGHMPDKHSSKNESIVLYVGNILGGTHDTNVTVAQLRSSAVRTLLVHELRHVMQRQQFRDFYHAQTSNNDYRTNPIELDAAFLHIMHSHSEVANSPYTFVKNVMQEFSNYKKLTSDQYKHYERKAAAYISQYATKNKKPTGPLSDRLSTYKETKWKSFAKSIIETDVTPLRDLRNVGSTDTGNFLLDERQVTAFKQSVVNMILNPALREHMKDPERAERFSMALSFLGMMKKTNPSIPAKQIVSALGVDMNKILEKLGRTDFGGYDEELFKNSAKSLISDQNDK